MARARSRGSKVAAPDNGDRLQDPAYRFAVLAVVTSSSSLWEASWRFVVDVLGGIGIGLAVGFHGGGQNHLKPDFSLEVFDRLMMWHTFSQPLGIMATAVSVKDRYHKGRVVEGVIGSSDVWNDEVDLAVVRRHQQRGVAIAASRVHVDAAHFDAAVIDRDEKGFTEKRCAGVRFVPLLPGLA